VADDIDRMYQRPVPKPDNIDLDKAYWYFWSKFKGAPIEQLENAKSPLVSTGSPLPNSMPPPLRIYLTTHLPPYNYANFYAKNNVIEDEVCGLYYKTWTNVASFEVPSNRLVVIEEISYEFENLPDNEVFEMQVLRNGEVLETFEDIKINSAAVNPAEHFAIGGHYLPVPFWGRFDHDEQILFRIKALGPEGPALNQFQRTDADFLNATFRVVMRGYMSSLRDNRNGVPKPVDDAIPMNVYGHPMITPELIEEAAFLMYLLEEA